MISIKINTKNGNLIELEPDDAKEVYEALKKMFEQSGKDPISTYPVYPIYPPYYPNWPTYPYPTWTWTKTSSGTVEVI